MKGSFVKRSKDSQTVSAGFRTARPLSAREPFTNHTRTEHLRPLSARAGGGNSAFCVVGMSKEAAEMKVAVSDLSRKKPIRPTSAYMYRKTDALGRNGLEAGQEVDGVGNRRAVTVVPGTHTIICVLSDVGSSLQDYQVIAKLGQGGSANVFLAKLRHDQSPCVLKKIVLGSKSPAPSSERFRLTYLYYSPLCYLHVLPSSPLSILLRSTSSEGLTAQSPRPSGTT